VTDRDAMVALARPEPDYFDEPAEWQTWHDDRIAALRWVRETTTDLMPTACPWPVRA
jgi:hypothetical protein